MIEGLASTVVVFNTQRHSIDDGPGIRTTGFPRGCLLRCLWCHNTGSQGWDLRSVLIVGNGRGAEHVFRLVHKEPSNCMRNHRVLTETPATVLGIVSMRPRVVTV